MSKTLIEARKQWNAECRELERQMDRVQDALEQTPNTPDTVWVTVDVAALRSLITKGDNAIAAAEKLANTLAAFRLVCKPLMDDD